MIALAGNTKGRSITVLLTSCLTVLELAVCKTDKFKPVKQEVNSTVRHPPLVFPGLGKGLAMTSYTKVGMSLIHAMLICFILCFVGSLYVTVYNVRSAHG
jgi:hypothetical protein